MAKKRITIYVESHTYDRIQRNKRIREQVFPPGWTKIASYAAHLVDEGLKLEEAALEERQLELQQKKQTNVR
jgi:hypothetical protein